MGDEEQPRDDEPDDEPRQTEEPVDDDETAPESAEDDADDGATSEPPADPEEALSPWQQKALRAQELWDAGNNAELREVIDELSKAPAEETQARAVAAEMARRLKPDPIAIGLWLVSLGVFCLLTYLFVIR